MGNFPIPKLQTKNKAISLGTIKVMKLISQYIMSNAIKLTQLQLTNDALPTENVNETTVDSVPPLGVFRNSPPNLPNLAINLTVYTKYLRLSSKCSKYR